MNIEEILEEIEELVEKSPTVPFVSHKKVVDSDRLRELISDARMNLPQELKEKALFALFQKHALKEIFTMCGIIGYVGLDDAKKDAELIIQKAEERASKIVSQEAIVEEAKKKAVEMIKKAQLTSQNIQKTAIVSITKMLDETEASYNKNLQSIRAVKAKFPAPKK